MGLEPNSDYCERADMAPPTRILGNPSVHATTDALARWEALDAEQQELQAGREFEWMHRYGA